MSDTFEFTISKLAANEEDKRSGLPPRLYYSARSAVSLIGNAVTPALVSSRPISLSPTVSEMKGSMIGWASVDNAKKAK